MCRYPSLCDSNSTALEGVTLADIHPDYYFRIQILSCVIGVLPLLYGMLISARKTNRIESSVTVLMCIAALIQIIRALDPSGLSGMISLELSLALLWGITSITANIQVSCLSGYIMILGHLQPEKNKDHGKLLLLTKSGMVIKTAGDVLAITLSFMLKDIYVSILTSFVLGSGVYIIHPVICRKTAHSIATLTSSVFQSTGSKGSRKVIEQRIRSISEQIRVFSAINVASMLILVIYTVKVQFTLDPVDTVSDPVATWTLFFYLVDVILPLLQMMIIFTCIRAFRNAAEVMNNNKLNIAAVFILTVTAALVSLICPSSQSSNFRDGVDIFDESD